MDSYQSEFVGKPERVADYKSSAKAEHAKTQSKGSPYTLSTWMQARAVMTRRVQIIRGDIAKEVVQLTTFIVQGIIMGTVFLKSPEATSAYYSRGGVLFL